MMNGENAVHQKTNASGGKVKPWEHVWSIDEMRKDASNWHLASDVGMLLHLQDFSQRMLARTHDIQEQIDAAVHEAKLTSVRVNNVFNDFITLANTQFVENRVYDEDVSGSLEKEKENKTEQKELSKEERETELISRIKEAVGLGLSILDSDYDRIDLHVDNSDSEDEGSAVKNTNVMYESKDPYIHRPLPHLIGSDEFERNDDVGLSSALPEEDEIHVDSAPNQSIATERAATTAAVSESVSGAVAASNGSAFQQDDSSSEDSDDLFSEVSSSQRPQTKDSNASNKQLENNVVDRREPEQRDFNSDLSAHLSTRLAAPPADNNITSSKDGKQQTQQPKAKRNSGDLFALPLGDDDDDEDDDGDIFRRPTGLFSASSQRPKLFDADNEDGGLFGTVPRQSSNAQTSTKAADKAESNIPDQSSTTSRTGAQDNPVMSQPTVKSGMAAPKGLFDDDEDDLFSAPSSKSTPSTAPSGVVGEKKKDAKPVVDLFSADAEDDDGDIFKAAATPSITKPKLPAGAVAIFSLGGDEQFKAAVAKSRTSQGDTEQVAGDGDDKFKPSAVKSLLHQSNAMREGSASPSTQSSSSLFAEDPELFFPTSVAVKTTASSTVTTQVETSKPKVNLFDDEEDDLFANITKTIPSKSVAPSSGQNKVSKLVVHDDDDDNDLFASVTKAGGLPTKSTIPTVQPAKVPADPPAKNVQVKSAPQNKPMSLFDDDDLDEEHGDLFGTTVQRKQSETKVAPPSNQQSKTNALGLFGDDMLFTTSDEIPGVDLFGSPPPVANKKSSDSTATAAAKQSPSVVGAQKNLPETALRKTSVEGVAKTKKDNFEANNSVKSVVGGSIVPASKVVDMFADEESDEEDLFSPSSKPSKSVDKSTDKLSISVGKPIIPTTSSGSLFNAQTKMASSEPLSEDMVADVRMPHSTTTGDDRKHVPPSVAAKPSSKHEVQHDVPRERSPESKQETEAVQATGAESREVVAGERPGKIAQLQSSLTINPAALLPSSKRPNASRNEAPVTSLDEPPPELQTLQSVSKDRVRIQVKRRPPTRKSNRLADVSDDINDDIFNGVGNFSDALATAPVSTLYKSEHSRLPDGNSVNDQSKTLIKAVITDDSSKPLKEATTDKDNSKLLKPAVTSKKIELPSAVEESTPEAEASVFVAKETVSTTKKITAAPIDDIFDTDKQKSANVATKQARNIDLFNDEDVDLFADSSLQIKGAASKSTISTSTSNVASDIFAEIPSSKTASRQSAASKSTISTSTSNVSSDIFTEIPSSKTSSQPSAASTTPAVDTSTRETGSAAAVKKPVTLDDDDIFADSLLAKNPKTSKVEDADIFGSKIETKRDKPKPLAGIFDEDDDDIFSVKAKPNSSKLSSVTQTVATKELTDEDDLFGSSSRRVAPTTRKKYATKDEDLFADDTDIFADVTLTSRSKVTTATKTQLSGAGSDDIFADAIAKPPPSSTKSAKTSVKKTTDSDDIFDDPLSAFNI